MWKAAAWSVGGLVALVSVPPAAFVGLTCFSRGAPAVSRPDEVQRVAAGLKNYYREEAATYLTLPEWYIVYSTEEYAGLIGAHPPSRFPYFGAARQYWRYYANVCRVTRRAYPFDPSVHLMLGVIGVSFTAENILKGTYEGTLGRLTEWIGGHRTEEDAFAQRTAREYGTFMHTVPWYEFPFGSKLRALWRDTPLWGAHPIRKWERRLALSGEYGVKAVYAWLIRRGTGAVYAPEDLQIYAWLDAAPGTVWADPRVRRVKETSPGSWVVLIPRYEPFTEVVTAISRRGARFRDIAGNDEILVTALTRRGWRYTPTEGQLLFSERILTDGAQERIAVRAPVRMLHAILAGLESGGARVEHVHDY